MFCNFLSIAHENMTHYFRVKSAADEYSSINDLSDLLNPTMLKISLTMMKINYFTISKLLLVLIICCSANEFQKYHIINYE